MRSLFIGLIALSFSCVACGGPTPAPADEVTASWTSGDDEPLAEEE